MSERTYEGFLLSQQQSTREGRTRLEFQGRLADGRRFHWTVDRPRIVFFVPRADTGDFPGGTRRAVELRDLRGTPVDAVYFPSASDHKSARERAEAVGRVLYEADISVAARLLMEHFIQGGVRFLNEPAREQNGILFFVNPAVEGCDFALKPRLLSLDIECSPDALYCVGLFGDGAAGEVSTVLMVEPGKSGEPFAKIDFASNFQREDLAYMPFPSEAALLRELFVLIREQDPDVLIGWNVIGFDLVFLERRCRALGLDLDLGLLGPTDLLEPAGGAPWSARVPGRAVLDGPGLVRSVFLSLPDYALGTVAGRLLGRGKLIEESGPAKMAEINRQYREDRAALARYNLEDARLVYEIFRKHHLDDLAIQKARYTGLALDRQGGSVAAFDFLYLPRLHRKGYVADTKPDTGGEPAPGGLVLDSVPGFFENVVVFDFKSLYPSIIRTFSVDPLAAQIVLHELEPITRVVKGPAGLAFAADQAILPDIIGELWAARDRAKAEKNAGLSYAVKIIMNSFYGVLGSPGCRFYDPRLAGTITRIGHWILGRSRAFIEETGHQVIYGDTDSLFIHLGSRSDRATVQALGEELSGRLNDRLVEILRAEFQVESRLTIEFETIYARFFMPTMRHVDTGSKKRYAGWTVDEQGRGELHFTGMESNRRDWTGLSHDFQRDLFTLIFSHAPGWDARDELIALIREYYKKLNAGEFDQRLVYRKGLSKPLDQYLKNAPPHVRAARADPAFEGRSVRYVMTAVGPEPVAARSGAPFDYEHYAEKQLAPIADMVLRHFNLEFDAITRDGMQMNLFDV